MRNLGRLAPAVVAAAALTLGAAGAAEARGFVSFGVGVPLYYGPPAYYAPPAYYYPPPVYYAPPPGYYGPPGYYPPPGAPTVYPGPAAAGECREYTTTSMVGGRPQQVYGTACRQPDGTWRIVR